MNLGQFMIKHPVKFAAFVGGGAVLIANLAGQSAPPPKPANPWALATPVPTPTGAVALIERDLGLAPAAPAPAAADAPAPGLAEGPPAAALAPSGVASQTVNHAAQ